MANGDESMDVILQTWFFGHFWGVRRSRPKIVVHGQECPFTVFSRWFTVVSRSTCWSISPSFPSTIILSGNQTWQWKILKEWRQYSIFHCHV
jgi:hypothetical protein